MARHRTFTLPPPPTVDDRVTFDVVGRYTKDESRTFTEHFACEGLAPAGSLDDLTASIAIDPSTGVRRYNTLACMGFLRQVLIPEDRERFEELLHDQERLVGLIDLVQIVAWLSDELTLRPTRPSSASTPGGERRDGEATPEGDAGSPGSILTASTPDSSSTSATS